MKNRFIAILTLMLTLTVIPAAAQTSGSEAGSQLGSILGGLIKGATGSGDTSDSSSSSSSSGSGLGNIIGGVADALGLGKKSLTIETLAGTWNYAGPAVNFKSDNLLLKAGGVAAAAQIEEKLLPYYERAGLTSLVLTVNTDSTFTMKAKRLTFSGTISLAEGGESVIFQFKALKSFSIGKMEGFVKLSGSDKMELTFDVSKLISLMKTIGSLSGNSQVQTLTKLLEQYDGLTAGFDMKKSAAATSSTSSSSRNQKR